MVDTFDDLMVYFLEAPQLRQLFGLAPNGRLVHCMVGRCPQDCSALQEAYPHGPGMAIRQRTAESWSIKASEELRSAFFPA